MSNITRICFIGGGNMTQAIIGGLLAQHGDDQALVNAQAQALTVIEPNAESRAIIAARGVLALPHWATPSSAYDVILLAVKPQVMQEALAPLAAFAPLAPLRSLPSHLSPEPLAGLHGHDVLGGALVVSIAAGVRTTSISRWLGGYRRIVRAMPNTPALIGAGITALFATPAVTADDRARAAQLLDAVGATIWLDAEAELDAVTAVSGSGPAYVFYFIEALEAAAIELGLSPSIARKLALETFRGSALLAASSTHAPATLRANVTSKRGTTERALMQFATDEVAARVIAGVKAAASRATELGDEMETGGALPTPPTAEGKSNVS